MQYFSYTEEAIVYLKGKDKLLASAIDEIGHIHRQVTPDLFCALVKNIVSQQISTKAAITVCSRITEALGNITPAAICQTEAQVIQQFGMSARKASYIKELAEKVMDDSINLAALHEMPDDAVCAHLSQIKGIGIWTAEMLMIFSMQRQDVFSWDDLAIHRGLRMLYRHRKITKELFHKYRCRYSPYASVASLYLWEIASGKHDRFTDPAPLSPAQKKARAKQRKQEAQP